MSTNPPPNEQVTTPTSPAILWLLIGELLFLRIGLLTVTRIFIPAAETWVMPVFEVGTYFLTCLFIFLERKRLSEFHIGRLALGFIILGKPLELLLYRLNLPYEMWPKSWAYWLYLPIGLGLCIALLVERPAIPRPASKRNAWLWPLAGILAGLALGVGFGLLARSSPPGDGLVYSSGSLADIWRVPLKLLVFLPLQQMAYAGIAEEPLFRGLLWGMLRRSGWKDVWIWLTQAGLFWLAHAYYFGHAPWSFWVVVPVGALVFGWLAWRSRSISTSMLAHGMANGFGQIVMFYL